MEQDTKERALANDLDESDWMESESECWCEQETISQEI